MIKLIKPGDIVILKPETLEKGQWRLARITDVHKNLDGVLTTASVRLPSGTVFTRTLRQIALLESANSETERTEAVTEESTERSISRDEEVRSGEGFDESSLTTLPDVGAGNRSRPDPSPCLEAGEPSSSCEYPGEVEAASTEPGPQAQVAPPSPELETVDKEDVPRSKRPRKRAGYYRQLNDGSL